VGGAERSAQIPWAFRKKENRNDIPGRGKKIVDADAGENGAGRKTTKLPARKRNWWARAQGWRNYIAKSVRVKKNQPCDYSEQRFLGGGGPETTSVSQRSRKKSAKKELWALTRTKAEIPKSRAGKTRDGLCQRTKKRRDGEKLPDSIACENAPMLKKGPVRDPLAGEEKKIDFPGRKRGEKGRKKLTKKNENKLKECREGGSNPRCGSRSPKSAP